MPQRSATATWEGDLPRGKGQMTLGSGAFSGPFSFQTRMGDEPGTNPEELIGAALAGCFSMALSAGMTKAGHPPTRIQTEARVHFEKQGAGFAIHRIDLATDVEATGLADAEFQSIAIDTKNGCPVAKALAGTDIQLVAQLKG